MQGVVLSIPPPDCECRQAPSGISIDGDGYDEVCSSCVRLGTKSAVSLEAACRGWLARSKCGRVRDHYRFAWIRYYLRNRDIEVARALGPFLGDTTDAGAGRAEPRVDGGSGHCHLSSRHRNERVAARHQPSRSRATTAARSVKTCSEGCKNERIHRKTSGLYKG